MIVDEQNAKVYLVTSKFGQNKTTAFEELHFTQRQFTVRCPSSWLG